MPRASIAELPDCKGVAGAGSLLVRSNKRMRDKDDAGKFSEARCLHRCTDARAFP